MPAAFRTPRPLRPPPHGQRRGEERVEAGPPAGATEGVMVNVGEGFGALVLYAGADRLGLEPEIHPAGRSAERQHVWVLERAVPGMKGIFAAVFPSLAAGRYAICSHTGGPSQEVEVLDGEVTEARWA